MVFLESIFHVIFSWFNYNYGLAIVVITFVTNILLLPLSLKNRKDILIRKFRISEAKDDLKQIKHEKKYVDYHDKTLQELDREEIEIKEKYKLSGKLRTDGFISLLITLPIIITWYSVIRNNDAVNQATFLGISLGSRSVISILVLVGMMFLNNFLGKNFSLIGTVLMVSIAWEASFGVALYFITTQVTTLIETLYVKLIIQPKVDLQIQQDKEDFKDYKKRKPYYIYEAPPEYQYKRRNTENITSQQRAYLEKYAG